MHNKKTTHHGFSLIELSIVVVILGLMIGGIMSALTQESRRIKQASLETKMDTIEQALIAYVKKNNRLPCPADGSYVISSEFFGVEGGTPGEGSCFGSGASYDADGKRGDDPTPPSAYTIFSNQIAGGDVPVRSLGLPDEYAFDPWGGRFTYAVDLVFSATNALASIPANSNPGVIVIYDTSGNIIENNASAVILSYGQNGHGAFLLSGKRKNAGSTNSNELINCYCTDTGEDGAFTLSFVTGTTNTTSTSDLRTVFDDNVRYYTRGSFRTNSDIKTEIK